MERNGSVDNQRPNNRGGATGKGFLPGKSGNPRGRPKGRTLTEILRAKLKEKGPDGKVNADAIAEEIIKQARAGHFQYTKELLERTEGKVPDRVQPYREDAATVLREYLNEAETSEGG